MLVTTIRPDRFQATYACPCGEAVVTFTGAEQRPCPACQTVYGLTVRVDRVKRQPRLAQTRAQEVRRD